MNNINRLIRRLIYRKSLLDRMLSYYGQKNCDNFYPNRFAYSLSDLEDHISYIRYNNEAKY